MPDDHRKPILIVVLIFTSVFAFLTLDVLFTQGPDVLTVASLLILAMLGFGVIGALREPPSRH